MQLVINHRSAFTLLEQALAIGILSLIIAGGSAYFNFIDEKNKNELTLKKMKVIEQALVGYYLNTVSDSSGNGVSGNDVTKKIPCPANPALSESNTSFGVIQETGSSSVCNNFATGFAGGYYGSVPTRTLSLPDYYMYDAWGRKFSFAQNRLYLPSVIGSDIPAANLSGALYKIISHGANGYGAYTKSGKQLPASSNSNEIYNSATTSGSSYSNIEDHPQEKDYDDLVITRTVNDFQEMTAGNYNFSQALCKAASAISSSVTQCKILKVKLQASCSVD